MRRRDAAARCPELIVVDRAAEHEIRTFEIVLSAVEEIAAGVTPIRPGLCALGVPSRFYGGEAAGGRGGRRAPGRGRGVGLPDRDRRRNLRRRAGGAAGRAAGLPVVAAGGSAGVPGRAAGQRCWTTRTWSACCAGWESAPSATSPSWPARDVLTRFGTHGAVVAPAGPWTGHRRRPPAGRRWSWTSGSPSSRRWRPSSRSCSAPGRPQTAGRRAGPARPGLHRGAGRGERARAAGPGRGSGPTPAGSPPSDLIDRLYWQLQGDPAPDPVTAVRLVPETVESLADHGEGLWGERPDERVERGVARLQGMLGPEEVLAPARAGRPESPATRQQLSPWGERPDRPTRPVCPGRGASRRPRRPGCSPSRRPALVLDADRRPVAVDRTWPADRRPPATSAVDRMPPRCRSQAWAGPWPIDELWWDPARARQVARFQVVGVRRQRLADGGGGRPLVGEARYD